MIYQKTTHPVEIKKIAIRVWGLRDEIEAQVLRRVKECEAAGKELFLEDIKEFYQLSSDKKFNESPELRLIKSEDTPDALENADKIVEGQDDQASEQAKIDAKEMTFQRLPPDSDKISYGFCFLSDINMTQLLCFTKGKYTIGQIIVVEFLIPQNFIMTCVVRYMHDIGRASKIISQTKPDSRIQASFCFRMENEREHLRKFLQSIEPDVLAQEKNKKSTTSQSPEA